MLKKIGFVGLGTVGVHMAANLAKSDYQLTVFDQDASAMAELSKLGVKVGESPMATAKGQDLVIVIVPESKYLVFGENGVLEGIDPGTILVDMGTHCLETIERMAEEAKQRRVMFLEAPVWGSKEHAANGLLTILAGGDEALLGRCREPFSYFGLNIIHIGKIGDATRMKLIVNLLQAEMMQSLSEGLVFGEKMGFKPDKILEVLDSGGVASPLFHSKGRSIARGDFSRNLALKYVDSQMRRVLEMAEKLGLDLPAAKTVAEIYDQAVKDGRGEEDFSAIVKLLRK
ncbi:NAD(P)-dependent oxidoreductase [Geomonas subterranea]|uniref:NAD(P)-dependent oxidoreductase n=1 Tax=Geomonas subterranea TaxID=2847989 RepID=A0ABX8LJE1_9BACT|nr:MULTISPECIES: NAD(P)-dependent oxidoreductase [Geomonas]QXE91843.1 NAD(P)-dependent oxidoreductase [Geomonas subterranea]QXM10064.1 NAD(P)-dependent oxidoreductase [Geomonas subterranea]